MIFKISQKIHLWQTKIQSVVLREVVKKTTKEMSGKTYPPW